MSVLNKIVVAALVIASSIYGQSMRLLFNDLNQPDTLELLSDELEPRLHQELAHHRAQGFWDVSIDLQSSPGDSNLIIAGINPGPETFVSNVHFQGIAQKDERFITREYLMGRSTIHVKDLQQAENRITNLGYRLVGDVSVSKDDEQQFHLNYTVNEAPELHAEALASFSRSANADTIACYGQINFFAPNIDGNGKSVLLTWKRLKIKSEHMMLKYSQPWILNIPLTASFQFQREVVNGLYQTIQSGVGLSWNQDWDKSLIFEYEFYQSLITHEGSLVHPLWRAEKKKMLGLGFRQISLNKSEHQGISLLSSLQQELNFEPSSLRIFKLRSEAELRLAKQLHLSQRSYWLIQNRTTAENDPSLLNPLGGVNSVRGFDESVIRAPSTISIQNNLNIQLGGTSMLFALLDFGLYSQDKSIESMVGYGLGVQLASGRGPISITIASHNGVAFRNSFLHIEYAGGVPWIDR